MRPKQKTLDVVTSLVKTASKIIGPKRATMMTAHLAEDLAPIIVQPTPFGPIKFLCPGKIPVYRARTLHTKEPDTLRWIEGFQEGEILWDIGANVGTYSVYAAVKGHRVLAFEPSASNYHLLCRNVELNGLSSKLSAYCFAFTDSTKLDCLYMTSSKIGSALNSFGAVIAPQNSAAESLSSQATLGFSVDDFIATFHPPFPDHLKIDVDGLEGKIVNGARRTMADRRLKSVLVELDRKAVTTDHSLIDQFAECGFEFVNESGLHKPPGRRGFQVYNGIFARRS